jgi:hypothetical protein
MNGFFHIDAIALDEFFNTGIFQPDCSGVGNFSNKSRQKMLGCQVLKNNEQGFHE